jgi:hypothetical protein
MPEPTRDNTGAEPETAMAEGPFHGPLRRISWTDVVHGFETGSLVGGAGIPDGTPAPQEDRPNTAHRRRDMSLTTLMQNIDDWCGTPAPGHPPRPPWLRDILTAVVLAELSASMGSTSEGRSLYAAAARLYESAADKVALNPQPLPPEPEQFS